MVRTHGGLRPLGSGNRPGGQESVKAIGANASLALYGGGVGCKRWLLADEGAAFEDLAVGRVPNAG